MAAFRRAGRAAAEIERREIVAIAVGQRLFGGFLQERLVAEADARPDADDVFEALDLARQSLHRFGEGRMGDQGARAGVPQQIDELPSRETRVHRHAHETGRHGAVVRLEIFADIGDEQRDPVALAQAEAVQRIPEPGDARVKLPERPRAEIIDDGGAVGVPARELREFCPDVHLTTH